MSSPIRRIASCGENAERRLSTEDTWSSENGDESAANGEQHADADDTGNFQSDKIVAEPDTPAEPKLSLVENSEQVEPDDAADESETSQETLVEDVEAFEGGGARDDPRNRGKRVGIVRPAFCR